MKIEMLFGGNVRFGVLEALADTRQPIAAYQIAMLKGLDPAATYRCLAEFLEFGIVVSKVSDKNQILYQLTNSIGKAASEFINSLREKTNSFDLEKWLSTTKQSDRMATIVNLPQLKNSKSKSSNEKQNIDKIMSRRIPEEMSALVMSSKIAFNELFKKRDGEFILNLG
jgi:hypothetical protein